MHVRTMVNPTLRIGNARTDAVLRVQKRLPFLGDVVHLCQILLDHGCCGRSEPPVQDLGAAPAVAKGLEHRVIRRYPFRYASVSTRRHVLNQPQSEEKCCF
jgi:hypothetical protein